MTTLVRIGVGATALLSLLACAPGASTGDTNRACAGDTLDLGDPLPSACTLAPFEGGSATLGEAIGGKPAVLNFWASWCVYCIEEMPDFQEVFVASRGEVAFLGIDLLNVQGETEVAARRLAEETGVTYPLAYDRDGVFYERICPCRSRPIMPTTILIRADGTFAHMKFGPLDANELRSLITEHLDVEVP